jgi:acyl-CoA thioesterase
VAESSTEERAQDEDGDRPAGGEAFDRDTAVELVGRDGDTATFAAEVSPDWRAGRGPHGGYIAALVLRAMVEAVADPARAPRSLTIHYLLAPQPGPVTIRATSERSGRSLSSVSARLEQDGRPAVIALAAFSVPWNAPELAGVQLPQVEPAEQSREAGTLRSVGAPPFTRHIVLQPRLGTLPFAGAEGRMEIGGWLGLAGGRPLDALALAFFSDALFPPPFVRIRERAVSPTIDLTIHFRQALGPAEPRDPGELVLARFETELVHEGFFDESGTIWAADGTLLAQSRQLAILMPIG